MGDAVTISPLRAGCELMAQGAAPSKITEHFGRAIQTVREFETKREVWKNRHALKSEIEKAKTDLGRDSTTAPIRVDLILSKTRASMQGGGWEHELLALDLQDRPNLSRLFADLDRIFSVVKHAAELGWNASIAIDAGPRLDLFGADEPDQKKATTSVLRLTKGLVTACDWQFQEASGILTVNPITGYQRPQDNPVEKSLKFQNISDSEGLRLATRDLAKLIREALYFVHFEMCRCFKPNIARAPMPEPFEIALPAPEPTFDTGHVAPPQLIHVRCATDKTPGDSVKVAVANLAIPLEIGRHYQMKGEVAHSVKADVRKALQAAEDSGCAAIAFPEYSVPAAMGQELLELAARHQLVIIAGLDGQWIDEKLCDQAIVAIPGEMQPHYQCKQEPSLDEEAGGAFYRDGRLLLFTNSPIGEFAVTLCSDLVQLSSLQAWKSDGPLPELLFVIARNNFPDLYMNFAKADSFRLYTAVVIANVCESDHVQTNDGSCAVMPLHGEQVLPATNVEVVGGVLLESFSVYDISLHAIRARSRGKPDKGYLAVPNWAKRD